MHRKEEEGLKRGQGQVIGQACEASRADALGQARTKGYVMVPLEFPTLRPCVMARGKVSSKPHAQLLQPKAHFKQSMSLLLLGVRRSGRG